MQQQQQQNSGFRGGPPGQAQQQFQAPQQQRPKPPVVLPKKPELEAICKHGVECTKPTCGFSHPSPVATKESGLVLSSEACDKQLSCQDPVRFLPLYLSLALLTNSHDRRIYRIALNPMFPLPKRTPLPPPLPHLPLLPLLQSQLLLPQLPRQTLHRSQVQERNRVNLEVRVRDLVACLCILGMSEGIRMVVLYLVDTVLLVHDVSSNFSRCVILL